MSLKVVAMADDIRYSAGTYLGRPYWQYYPAENPAYASRYVTRGWGWKRPWNLGTQAAEKLSLPPYNPASAARQVSLPWRRYLPLPRRVAPANGLPGGGWEYVLKTPVE